VTHDQVEAMTMASRIAVINKGLLQQIDTPQNLYDAPNNVFVAGFMGSPAMNFFPAKLRKDNGKMIVDTGDFTLTIPADRAKKFEGHTNKNIVFGIRPENIHDGDFTLTIPTDRAKTYEGYTNKNIIFGIRPENLHDGDFIPPNIHAEKVAAKVDVTELMGNEIYLYLITGKNTFVGRVDPRSRMRMGDNAQIAFNMDKFHIFDAETEQAIR
jgi:multiple sugar transport system ATP-binding protein